MITKVEITLSDSEQLLYDNYIAAYKKDYPGLTRTDLIQLSDSAIYHILQYRLIRDGATTTTIHNVRTSPKQLERSILSDLGLTRHQRITTKQPDNSAEDELRELLLSISNGSKQ